MKPVSLILVFTFCCSAEVLSQQTFLESDFFLLENRYEQTQNFMQQDTTERNSEEFPSPKSVMFKSLMVPGWGQITNKQIWKVPIIYGLFTGIGFYTFHLDSQYKDYRAAYYNAVQGEDNDFRFGPTPPRLEGLGQNQLLENRTSFRNRRDFMVVVFALAYGLNALDAYVYAHMRSFDVSDDLSARTVLQPTLLADGTPGLKFSLSLNNK